MRIGVVSDTHNHLRNVSRIVELFNTAGVERVVHTGDITQAKTLAMFGALEARLVGVFGNNDVEREALEATAAQLDIRLEEPPLSLDWDERRLLVGPHESAVADHIGGEDGGEPALDALLGHEAFPPQLRVRKTIRLWVG